jgi:hypothetical protein
MERNKSHVHVQFYLEAIPDGVESAKQERQVFKEVEMVKVVTLGDKDNNFIGQAHHTFGRNPNGPGRITPAQRYPEQYAAFKAGMAEAISGTPLKLLPFLGAAQIADLTYNGIKTAEQLADLPEAAAAKGFGWRELRSKAALWLEETDKFAVASKARAEADAANARADDMAKRLADMEAKLAALDEPKRGPGRPRKEEVDA